MKNHSRTLCSRYHHAVELLGRRWAGAIVWILLGGPSRFNELRTMIPEITDRMLSERLRDLEKEGLLVRTVLPESPVRVEYSLTDKGRSLAPTIEAIGRWAEHWLPVSTSAKLNRENRPRPRSKRQPALNKSRTRPTSVA